VIMHVVVFRWNKSATPTSIAAADGALAALVATLPQIVEYRHGSSIGMRAGAADYGVVAVANTRADLLDYLDHPEHQRILSDLLAPITAERLATQVEIEPVP